MPFLGVFLYQHGCSYCLVNLIMYVISMFVDLLVVRMSLSYYDFFVIMIYNVEVGFFSLQLFDLFIGFH